MKLTGATSSNLSNHLRVLRHVGAVEAEPAGDACPVFPGKRYLDW